MLSRVYIPGHGEGLGGAVSFRRKAIAALAARGVEVTNDLEAPRCDAALINPSPSS